MKLTIHSNDITKDDLDSLFELMCILTDTAIENKLILLDISHWEKITAQNDVVVVRDVDANNRIVGTGSLIESMQPLKSFSVQDVVAHTDYRGHGVGKMVMDKLVSIAQEKNIKEIILTSSSHRVEARGLYEKLGWVYSGETTKYKYSLQ